MSGRQFPEWMRTGFSEVRLGPYLRAVAGDHDKAVRLYWWNVEVSGAFYAPLNCLEVALRNAIHQTLVAAHGQEVWWRTVLLAPHERRAVADADATLRRRLARPATADDVIASLSFGFWVSLLSRGHDRTLWVPTLHRAFPHYSGRRRMLHEDFETMRLLRNRIMHHEPIHHRELAVDRDKIYRLLGHLDPELEKQVRSLDRITQTLLAREDVCEGLRPPRF